MKPLKLIMFVLLLCGVSQFAFAAMKPAGMAGKMERFYKNFPGLVGVKMADYINLSPREYEKASGKKLKPGEKLVYKVVKWKLKKKMRNPPTETQRTLGLLSLGFGVLAFVFLFIPATIGILGLLFAIAGFVLGLKSLKGNSNGPGLIGLILSSLVLFIAILAVIAISSWGIFE